MSVFTAIPQKLRPHFYEGAKIVLWFFLAAALAVFVLHSLLAVLHPYQLDYGEAPLIDQAMRLAAGENIYRPNIDTPPYTIANYPPLYVLSLIPFLDWFDSPFHMARAISVVATLLSATFLGLTIWTFSKNRLAALSTALIFLASPYVVQWSGRARIDSLALAFATAALFVVARWPRARWGWLGSGLLLVAAAYTRQSYALAAPLAAFVWLWTQDKRRALALALLVGGLGIALFLLLNVLTDGGFYYNIVTANVNEFGWERLKGNLDRLWQENWIILLLSALFLSIGWRQNPHPNGAKPWPLLAAFWVGAFLSGLTIGKIGSNINYFLELSAALALVAGMLIDWTRAHPWRNTAATLLIACQFGMLLESSMLNNVDWILTPRRADFTALQLLEHQVKRLPDPVLADEYMGMLTQNGRPLYLQPFEVTQLANAGMWDQQPLLDEIADEKFSAILIHHFGTWPVHKERWSPEMLAAIEQHYRPFMTLAGTVIHIPKGHSAGSVPATPRKAAPAASPVWEGQPIPISAAGFLAEPSITLNPQNPDQLNALATQVSKQDCQLPHCIVELALFSSSDGGESWQQTATFSRPQQVMYHGLVTFDPAGALFVLGVRNDVVVLNQASAAENYIPESINFVEVTRAQVNARPWLRSHPESGELYLTFDAQENDMRYVTPSLIRSEDGLSWSLIGRADQHVAVEDINAGRATALLDIQALFGEGERVALVWAWDAEPWSWPRTVWLASSTDGGVTFGEPAPIAETWGPINTASAQELFALVYRVGSESSQQLAVAVSADNGESWSAAIASGDLPLYFEAEKAPGIGISPTGTIDLVFYGHDPAAANCALDVQSWQWTLPFGRVDPCTYNVFYTFSSDGGLTFSEPLQLNDQPIRGEDFVRYQGGSQPGSHLAVASGEAFAYPIWVGTPAPGQTQVFTAKIAR